MERFAVTPCNYYLGPTPSLYPVLFNNKNQQQIIIRSRRVKHPSYYLASWVVTIFCQTFTREILHFIRFFFEHFIITKLVILDIQGGLKHLYFQKSPWLPHPPLEKENFVWTTHKHDCWTYSTLPVPWRSQFEVCCKIKVFNIHAGYV